ncbi:MAG: T9SS type A sorting domain-containing protein [Bacteroidales bacterium]|nr:T9SS type A sorting domain-containing protein [Bacteroidales bacterium]
MRNTVLQYSLILLFFFCWISAEAQTGVVSGGGSSAVGLYGSEESTIGQPFCDYGVTPDSYIGEGVQQPYDASVLPPESCDTLYSYSEITTCDSITWRGLFIDRSGTYRRRLVASTGCDSILVLVLTVSRSSHTYDSAQASTSYVWQGATYLQSGTYQHPLRNANAAGCDSIMHLHLALLTDAPLPRIRCYDRRLLVVDHYPGGEGSERADYRAYRWYRNGQPLPFATADYYVDFHEGEHRYLTGCFYVEVMADEGYWVRSNTICLDAAKGAGEDVVFAVYPTPSQQGMPLTAELYGAGDGCRIEIYDLLGRRLFDLAIADGVHALPLSLTAGTYSVVLRQKEGSGITKKIIVR